MLGETGAPRIISFYGFELDISPQAHMAFFKYVDKPGVIGRIGTALGNAGINVGSMEVDRKESGGTALMTIGVDSPLTAGILAEIAADPEVEMTDAWYVTLD